MQGYGSKKQAPGSFSFMCIELYNWIVFFLLVFTIKEHSAKFMVSPKHKYTGPLHICLSVNFSHCFKIFFLTLFSLSLASYLLFVLCIIVFFQHFSSFPSICEGVQFNPRDLGIEVTQLAINVKTSEVPFLCFNVKMDTPLKSLQGKSVNQGDVLEYMLWLFS